jgi:putative ABC transport system permease protein
MVDWKQEIKTRIAGLNLTPLREAEIVEELTQHLDDFYSDLLAGGATPEEAYRAALAELTALQLPESDKKHRPQVIGTGRSNIIGNLWQDLRYSIRMLRKNPGFASVTILILALGIGANTAIFSVVNAVLLRPLPYPESERLMQLYREDPPDGGPVSVTKFLFWREHNRTFDSMAAIEVVGAGVNLTGGDEPQRIRAARVSVDYFRVYGISPARGRSFSPEEDRPGGDRVIVISDSLWKQRFGADAGLLGKEIELSGERYTVIGIMPPGLEPDIYADVWLPLRPVAVDQEKANPLRVTGRLKGGVTAEQAVADMDAVAESFRQQHPAMMNDGERIATVSYQQFIVRDVRTSLLVLLGAVAFVLLIACANVASLLLARAAARQREVAIRSALGAGRFRLIQQSLTESALLALLGGALGILVARLGLEALLALVPGNLPRLSEIQLDGRALLFTLAVALSTGILFGVAPAFQLAGVALNSVLNESGARGSAGIRRSRLRSLIVVFEIALSSLLLIGAALLIQTFANLRGVDPGFEARNVLTMQMSLPEAVYNNSARVSNFFDRALQRIEALPGVETAAVVTRLPLENTLILPFRTRGMQEDRFVFWRMITPNYFKSLRIPLRRGRSFSEGDSGSSPAVVLINEAMVRQYFPDKDPIGELLTTFVIRTEGDPLNLAAP